MYILEISRQISRQTASGIFWVIGHKSYDVALGIVQRALRLVQHELDLEDEEELKVMAQDVLCIEATNAIQLRGL